MTEKSTESERYARLGASSSKKGLSSIVGKKAPEFFASPIEDLLGDSEYYSFIHADGAGTKSIVAYLAYRESGDVKWFRSLAQDSLVMNLDDLACVGAVKRLALSNTIGRNRALIPDSVITEIVNGYKEQIEILSDYGIEIKFGGGETADLGDLVRTVVIDSTLFTRVRREEAIGFSRVSEGDVIVGLSSTGKAAYESKSNFGIGSNGYTLARHCLLSNEHVNEYPEILAPETDPDFAYQGNYRVLDTPEGLGVSVAEALLSPTRTYTPLVIRMISELRDSIHGLVHCTGGGQTKIGKFLPHFQIVKNDLFETPAIFKLIKTQADVPWEEMYSVFNMGHRMEVICPLEQAEQIQNLASEFNIESKIVGQIRAGSGLVLTDPEGNQIQYSA